MSENNRGKLIVIDAIDGAGKSTAINGVAQFFESHEVRPSLDLVAFQKEHGRLPEPDELAGNKILLAAEPTHSWIGAAIREELIAEHADRSYSGLSAAHAFSLDREILYKRVIKPFLSGHPERFVIQDRGMISSLAYQPLQDASLSLEDVLALPGNQVELSCAPDLIFLLAIEGGAAQKRLASRGAKQDHHIFEKGDFLTALASRYVHPEVQKPFLERGTKIVEIDASQNPEMIVNHIIEYIKPLL